MKLHGGKCQRNGEYTIGKHHQPIEMTLVNVMFLHLVW